MDVTSYLLGKQAGGGSEINNQNKDVEITENGSTTVSADAGYTGLGTVGITTNVTPNLQNKSETISSNTTTQISADSGYDGLGTVSVTTNVQPNLETKSVTINENTITTITPTAGKDGMSSVEVTTNVSGGATTIYPYSISFRNDTSNFNLDNIDFSNLNSGKFDDMFNGCSGVTELHFTNLTKKPSSFKNVFKNCSKLETVNFEVFDLSSILTIDNLSDAFTGDSLFTDSTLDKILVMLTTASTQGTLWGVGLRHYNIARLEALPHYQDFIDAGWTIGY